MNKEKQPIYEGGYSEEAMDRAMEQTQNLNQVKAGNIFDPKQNKKPSKDK